MVERKKKTTLKASKAESEKASGGGTKAPTTRQLTNQAKVDPYQWAKKAKISELVKLLEYLSKAYYNGEALVEDDVYDLMLKVLDERDPSNSYLDEVGAPIAGENKVTLPVPMRSLDKVRPDTQTLIKRVGTHDGKAILSDKLDGISALIYRHKDSINLYTRGNGKEGQDITHLLPSLVKKSVLDRIPIGTAIRCELIMTESDFQLHFAEEFKNARNLVAGVANSKTMDSKRKQILRYLHLVPYLVMHPVIKPTKQMKKLVEWGFTPVWHKVVDADKVTDEYLQELFEKRKERSPYRIDGIVVTLDIKEAPVKSGNPLHSFAFKNLLSQQLVEVKVTDVTWRISKDAHLKPTVHIEPTEVSEVTISKATAFNAKWIKENKIAPGAIVKVIRSGDVIPYIIEVVKPAKKPLMPPGEWEWTETGVDAIGTGSKWEREIAIAKNTYFFSTIGVRGLSEGTVVKLYDAGFKDPKSIIKAKPSQLSDVERMGEKSAKKLCAAIRTALTKLTWEKIMVASQAFGRSFGIRKIRAILRAYPDILQWKLNKKKVVAKIEALNGFAEKTAERFAVGLGTFHKFLATMGDLLPKLKMPEAPSGKGKFKDMRIVFTGFRDKELQDWVESEGGSVTTSVSNNTTMVVYRGEGQAKVVKARELGLKMMTYEEFVKKYKR